MEIIVKAPASCGELIEGSIAGTPFLVTAPISVYATATVSDAFTGMQGLGTKAQEAVTRALALVGKDALPWGIRLESPVPQGKGMASSSADITACAYAAARAFGRELTARELMDIAIAIEPSDGIAFEGLSHVSHTTGALFGQYRNVPLIGISIFDVGGEVDTISYYQSKSAGGSQDDEYRRLLDTVDSAFHTADYRQEIFLGERGTGGARLWGVRGSIKSICRKRGWTNLSPLPRGKARSASTSHTAAPLSACCGNRHCPPGTSRGGRSRSRRSLRDGTGICRRCG